MLFKCDNCIKEFCTLQNLTCHLNKKNKCSALSVCPKCEKTFKYPSNLARHSERKTSCDPIKGNPLLEVKENMCTHCHFQCVNKKSLTKHYLTCKIKNGGVPKLLAKVLAELNIIKQRQDNVAPQHIINNYTINHNNTTLNIKFENYDSFEHNTRVIKILKEKLPELLLRAPRRDVGVIPQIQDRIEELVVMLYRNPNHKDLQNIYVLDPSAKKDNALIYDKGWCIRNWGPLFTEIIQKIRLHACPIKGLDSTLSLRKHIELLSGDRDTKNEGMSNEEFTQM